MIGALLLVAAAGSPIDDGWPPLRYRRDTQAVIHFVDPKLISGVCDDGAPDPDGGITIACGHGYDLWLPNPCTYPDDDEYAHVVCHELGHVNGWSGNHPGSREHK